MSTNLKKNKQHEKRPEHYEIMRRKRRVAGVSVQWIAEQLKVSAPMVSMAERGLRPWPEHWDAIYNEHL